MDLGNLLKIKDYLKNMILALLIGAVSAASVGIFNKYFQKPKHEFELSSQLKTLDNVSDNLVTLQKFINDQKKSLVQSEKTIKELKEEEKKIKPLIEADRKTIEAIFKLQAEVSARNVWFDRGMAFILGVISSLFATLIIGIFKRK